MYTHQPVPNGVIFTLSHYAGTLEDKVNDIDFPCIILDFKTRFANEYGEFAAQPTEMPESDVI